MKYRLVLFTALALVVACNSVTVVPIDDEDAGDGGTEATAPPIDAASDAPATDAPNDATSSDGDGASTDAASDAPDDG